MVNKLPFPNGTARRRVLEREDLDQLSADILTYLAEEPSRLSRFFDLTGLDVDTLRRASASETFVGQLVDYITSDARRLEGFASAKGYDPTQVDAIRVALQPPVFDP